MEFRADFPNLHNHPTFAAANGTYAASTFGHVLGMMGSPRDAQFGLKLDF